MEYVWLYIFGAFVLLVGITAFFGAPYVPSHRKDVRRVLKDGLQLGESDVLLDIGSGDGIVLREASKLGARAVGYEIHPLFVGLARLLSWRDANVRVELRNAWTAPFPSDVTTVYAFSVARDALKLERAVQREATRLNRELRLVCYGSPLKRPHIALLGAYYLYEFEPLRKG